MTNLLSFQERRANTPTPRPGRPSLRINRHLGRAAPDCFTVEIWSPFTACYQPVDSIGDGLRRVEELARLIGQMWLQRHPKRVALIDAPDADEVDGVQWAEFRRSAMTGGRYDTRCFDRTTWTVVAGSAEAIETTCGRVGYVQPDPVLRRS